MKQSGGKTHQGSKGSMPYDRIKMYGTPYGKIGEGLAFGNMNGDEFIMNLFTD